MKTKLVFTLILIFLGGLLLVSPQAQPVEAQGGSTIWDGPTLTFTKPSYADYTSATYQDRLTDNVWLTRGDEKGLFNIAQETVYQNYVSPIDTEWASGDIVDYASLTYHDWETWLESDAGRNIVDNQAVVHLISDDIYIPIRFTSWINGKKDGGGGGFSYERGTPRVVYTSVNSGSWFSDSTWDTGSVPISNSHVIVASGNIITIDGDAASHTLTIAQGSELEILASGTLLVENSVTNYGTLQQEQTVNNANVEFLHIQSASGSTQYRGVVVDSRTYSQNLGVTTVSVRELNSGEYCTIDEGGSPGYAGRCYAIFPGLQPEEDVRLRLYARTGDELNGITESNLSVYRYQTGSWTELITNRATGHEGVYSYAEGDTPGFSSFLLGEMGNVPTAVTLQSVSIVNQTANIAFVIVAVLMLALCLLWLGWRVNR